MKTSSGFALTAAFLSVVALAATGCSGIAIGNGVPGADATAAPADEPSQDELVGSADAGAPKTDASTHADAGATKPTTKPATITAIIDGNPATSDGSARPGANAAIDSSINFAAPGIYGSIWMSIRITGSGCSLDSGNAFLMADFSSSSDNTFQPEQRDGACGLAVTAAGATRISGSFQGTVTNSSASVRHTIGLSFDIPVE
jgi:hypothetical protein